MSKTFLLSVPKSATANPHRKVTVESVDKNGIAFDMKEFLLASSAEPKDVLPAVGFDTFQTLSKLCKVWDVIEEMNMSLPNVFEGNDEPILKLCHHLLVNKRHPAELLTRAVDLGTIKNLLELQLDWKDIKENHRVAEPACDYCGCAGAVLRCSGCMLIRKEIRYCNKECQMAGWAQHKKDGCGREASDKAKKRVARACARQMA